jgi:hypothetical protein
MSTDDVLTPDAIELLHLLQRELGETRQEVTLRASHERND